MKQGHDRKKNLFIDYPRYKIPEEFEINTRPDLTNGKQFNLNLLYHQHYDFKTGNKLFLRPRLSMLSHENMPYVATRKFDYIFDFPYNKTDTAIYILSAGISVDKLPVKKDMENGYASYKNEYIKNESGNVVTVIGNLSLKKHIIPRSDYL